MTAPFFGTQARILMTEWKAIAKCIIAHSVPAKEKPIVSIDDLENFDIENLENINFAAADELPNILDEKNIQIALQGPFGGMLRDKLAAYAKISRWRLEIHLSREELFKSKRTTSSEPNIFTEKKLEKCSSNQLDEIQVQLDSLTDEHEAVWIQFIHDWTQRLIHFLSESNLRMTEREINELRHEDIPSELLPRFIEVSLKLPKQDYSQMTFVDYLYLKGLLTLQSALSRQHLPHDDALLAKKLQPFEPELAQMRTEEQNLLTMQNQQTNPLIPT